MLWTIAVLLLILWLLGMVSSYTLGGFTVGPSLGRTCLGNANYIGGFS